MTIRQVSRHRWIKLTNNMVAGCSGGSSALRRVSSLCGQPGVSIFAVTGWEGLGSTRSEKIRPDQLQKVMLGAGCSLSPSFDDLMSASGVYAALMSSYCITVKHTHSRKP